MKGTNYEVKLKVMVRYGKTIVSSPYSDPIAILTTSSDTAFEKLRSGMDTFSADVDERCTTLEGSVEGLDRDRVVLENLIAAPHDFTELETSAEQFFRRVGITSTGMSWFGV